MESRPALWREYEYPGLEPICDHPAVLPMPLLSCVICPPPPAVPDIRMVVGSSGNTVPPEYGRREYDMGAEKK